MSDEKAGTEMLARCAPSRGYAAARRHGWRGRETEAFIDGAQWMLDQMQAYCDIASPSGAPQPGYMGDVRGLGCDPDAP